MQLRLDAQIHVDIQRVVVGDEGAGRLADLQRAQHGGIDLEAVSYTQLDVYKRQAQDTAFGTASLTFTAYDD